MFKAATILCTMVSGSAIAPTPLSLHIKVFSIGGISAYPHDFSVLICVIVTGWSHMNVFIAGAKSIGFLKSHALQMQVNKLSHIPYDNFANVFASKGAYWNIQIAHIT